MNRAVFLDRDGVINKDIGFCKSYKDFELLPNVPEAIRWLNKEKWKVIIVTDQSGVGRGGIDRWALPEIHSLLREKLWDKNAFLDAIYCCIHTPESNCDCRKPRPGLLLKASSEQHINLKESWLIGDKETDIEAGETAGCRTLMVDTNEVNLLEAVAEILLESRRSI